MTKDFTMAIFFKHAEKDERYTYKLIVHPSNDGTLEDIYLIFGVNTED